jgi:hypothetical protein
MQGVVGWTLILGLVVFLVGAAGWRLEYERPMLESLPVIHADRRRRAWIHLWMIPALFLTTAGLAGLSVHFVPGRTAVLVAMATAVYALGAITWVVSLAFRLTVVPWAAEQTTKAGQIPDPFPPLDAWAGALYVIHMVASYVAFVIVGAGLLLTDLPAWVGWFGVGLGAGCLTGFVATRAAGPFNPPVLAHLFTGVLGVALLVL